LRLVGVIFAFALLGALALCFLRRSTLGASGAAGAGVLGRRPVVVVFERLLPGGGAGATIVVVVVGWLVVPYWGLVVGVVLTGVEPSPVDPPAGSPAPSAVLESCPPRLAAVSPPPARALNIARHARRPGRFSGCIRRVRSSCGLPIVVVGAAGPQARGTRTRIHIGKQPGIRKGFVSKPTNRGSARAWAGVARRR